MNTSLLSIFEYCNLLHYAERTLIAVHDYKLNIPVIVNKLIVVDVLTAVVWFEFLFSRRDFVDVVNGCLPTLDR